jgi:hypothetical protein
MALIFWKIRLMRNRARSRELCVLLTIPGLLESLPEANYSRAREIWMLKTLDSLESSRKRIRGEDLCELWTNCSSFLLWKVRLARTISRVRRNYVTSAQSFRTSIKGGWDLSCRVQIFGRRLTLLKLFHIWFLLCEGKYKWWWSLLN